MIKVNITMCDGSYLHEIVLFKSKELGDSMIRSKSYIKLLLEKPDKTIYFSGKYVQGGFIPQQVVDYEMLDDTEEIKCKLEEIIHDNYEDLNMIPFILQNRESLLNILK